MPILTHKCPHCQTEHIALQVVHIGTFLPLVWECTAHMICPKCRLPSCAHLHAPITNKGVIQKEQLSSYAGDILNAQWVIKGFWPEPPRPVIPDLLPPDVARIYLQAERNFPIEGSEEAAGTMYRKALDVALKKVDGSAAGTLASRIKRLSDAGKLTPDIATWADGIIRVIGNEAAHEETPISRVDLDSLRSFSEMTLRYLFTLPNMVKKRRGEQLEWEN